MWYWEWGNFYGYKSRREEQKENRKKRDEKFLNDHFKRMIDIFYDKKKKYIINRDVLILLFIICKNAEFIIIYDGIIPDYFVLIRLFTLDIYCSCLIYRLQVYINDLKDIINKYGITVYGYRWHFISGKYD